MDIAKLRIQIDTRDLGKVEKALRDAGVQAKKLDVEVDRSSKRIKNSLDSVKTSAFNLQGAFAGLVAAVGVRELVQAADTYTNINSKLRLVTGSIEGAKTASEQLFAVSQRTRQSFDETVTVFQRFSNGTKELGISQARLLAVVQTVNKAVTLSGASAQSAQAALVQLGQGLASGTLRGEELNSVLEQTPALAQALADGLGVGIGELRAMGAAGEITAQKVIEALERMEKKIADDFSKVAVTVDQAFTNLRNSATRSIGEIDKATGATSALAQELQDLSEFIDENTESIAALAKEFAPFLEGGAIALGVIGLGAGFATLLTRINPIIAALTAVAGLYNYIATQSENNPNGVSRNIGRMGRARNRTQENREQERTVNLIQDEINALESQMRTGRRSNAANQARRVQIKALQDEMHNLLLAEFDGVFSTEKTTEAVIQNNKVEKTATEIAKEKADAIRRLKAEQRSYEETFGEEDVFAPSNEMPKALEGYFDKVKEVQGEVKDLNAEVAKQFEDDLVDAFETAFLRGGDFAESFRRAIEAQFAEMVLRPVISAIVGDIKGLGTQALGGQLGGVANQAVGALSGLAKIAGGVAITRQLSGGYSMGGVGDALTDVAGALAFVYPPLAAIAGAANQLFGRKPFKTTATGLSGTFSEEGFTGVSFADQKSKGGLFRSNKSRTLEAQLEAQAERAIDLTVQTIFDNFESAGRLLQVDLSKAIDEFTLSGKFATTEAGNLESILQQLEKAFSDTAIPAIQKFQREGETLSQTALRLGVAVDTTDDLIRSLGLTVTGQQKGFELAENVVNAVGQSIGNLGTLLGLLNDETELAAIQSSLLDDALFDLGLGFSVSGKSSDQLKAELIALTKGIDVTTAAGQRELAALLALSPELANVISQREAEELAASEQAKQQAEAAAKIAEANAKIALSIEETISSIRIDMIEFANNLQDRTNSLSADSFSLAISQLQAKADSVNSTAFGGFINTISTLKPTDTAYRGFVATISALNPTTAKYSNFVDAISGFTPNTAAYKAFTDAVSGTKPTDVAYRDFIASVQGLKPTDANYKAFVDAVQAATNGVTADNLTNQINNAQSSLSGFTTFSTRQAVSLLESQITQLENTTNSVDFSRVTNELSKVDGQILTTTGKLATVFDPALNEQLSDSIRERYALEQQLLGEIFNSFQALFGSITGERVAVRQAAVQILGNPQVLSAADIQAGIAGVGDLGTIPDLDLSQIQRSQATATAQENVLLNRLGFVINEKLFDNGSFSFSFKDLTLKQSGLAGYSQSPRIKGELLTGNGFSRSSFNEFGARVIDKDVLDAVLKAGGGKITASSDSEPEAQQKIDRFYSELNSSINNFLIGFNESSERIAAIRVNLKKVLSGETEGFVNLENASVLNATKKALEQYREAEQKRQEALQEFSLDAQKAVKTLSKLREETVKYYQAQEQLANLMLTSATNLRATVGAIRFADLSPESQLNSLLSQFDAQFQAARSASGQELAGFGTEINSLINPILDKAAEVYASSPEFQTLKDSILSQAEEVATRLEELAPKDYQQESLGLLGSIDTSLAEIEQQALTAERLLVDAINSSADRTVNALGSIYEGITGQTAPAFAMGGMHSGGIRLVGERGPELEVTGPSRIIPNNQLMGMMRPQNNADVVAELRESNRLLMGQMRVLQASAQQQMADNAEMKAELQMLRKKAQLAGAE